MQSSEKGGGSFTKTEKENEGMPAKTDQYHKRGKKQTEKRRTWIETEKESKTGKNRLRPQWEKSVKETKKLPKQIN